MLQEFEDGKADRTIRLELWERLNENLEASDRKPLTHDLLAYGGDPAIGKKLVFSHPAAQCIRCHQAHRRHPRGIGPTLLKIGKKYDRDYLVRSILDPSADIADGYGIVSVTTYEDETIAGTLIKRSKSVWQIKLPDGKTQKVKQKDIKTHVLTSAMPPMSMMLKPREVRDIVAYLASMK